MSLSYCVNTLRKLIEKNWPVLLIILASFAPLIWFRGDYLITGTDVDFSPFNINRFIHRLQTWDSDFMGGSDRSNNVASLFFIGVFSFFEFIGLGSQAVEKAGFIFWLLLVGLSMNYLMTALLKKNGVVQYSYNIARASAALMYMYGFYNIFLWVRLQLSLSTLVMFPMFLALLIQVFERRLSVTKAAFITITLAIVCSSTGIQPPLLYIFSIFIVTFLLFYIFCIEKINAKTLVELSQKFLILSVAYILGSMYWLTSLFSYILNSGYLNSSIGMEAYNVKALLSWVSTPTSFLQVFRQYGDVAWFDGFAGYPYWPDIAIYQNSGILISISFLIILIALLPLLVNCGLTARRYIVFFWATTLATAFFSKGIHSPFGDLYLWMVDNIPLFWIQRAPWQKFGLLLSMSFAVLFGFGAGVVSEFALKLRLRRFTNIPYLQDFQRSLTKILILVLIFISTVFYNWKFVSGAMYSFGKNESQVGYHEKFNLGFHITYPDYAYSMAQYLNSQKDYFKVFFLPDFSSTVYFWGYAGSTDVAIGLIKKGLIHRSYGEGLLPPNTIEGMQDLASRKILNEGKNGVAKLLGFWGVKYILLRNDYWHSFYGQNENRRPEILRNKLDALDDISLEKSFGMWDLYRVDDKYFVEQLTLPSTIVSIAPMDFTPSGNKKFLENFYSELQNNKSVKNTLFVNNTDFERISAKISEATKNKGSIDYKKLSSTYYEAILKNVDGVIPLVFGEGFHRGWRLYGRNPIFDMQPKNGFVRGVFELFGWIQMALPIEMLVNDKFLPYHLISLNEHFTANGFQNGWIFDTNALCHEKKISCHSNENQTYNAEIFIRYSPQRIFYLGIFTTLVALLFSILIIFIRRKS